MTTQNLTPAQYDAIERTMNPAVRDKIAMRFVEALDAGHDLYLPDGTSPAGEAVVAAMVAEARAMGWAPETLSMLRWNIRAVGRRIILDTFAAV